MGSMTGPHVAEALGVFRQRQGRLEMTSPGTEAETIPRTTRWQMEDAANQLVRHPDEAEILAALQRYYVAGRDEGEQRRKPTAKERDAS